MLGRRVFLGALASFAWTGSARAGDWEQIDDADGVRVYSREVPGSPLVAFRGEAVFDHAAERILWLLADNAHRTAWVDRLVTSTVLEKRSDYDYVLYQHFGLPAVISDRDYVYRGRIAQRKGSRTITLELSSIEHPKAPPTVGVRAHLIGSAYRLTPLGPGKTHVEVEIHTDPRGLIPTWLVNLIQKSWPMKTLTAMRREVGKPYVGTLAFPPAP